MQYQQSGASDPESSIAHGEAWLYPVNIINIYIKI